jgi:hypothetical protein
MYHGCATGHGMVRDDDRQIVLEWQVEYLGLWTGKMQSASIPLTDIKSVEIQGAWLGGGAKIVIALSRLEAAAEVPGLERGRVVLNVAARDREAAQKFVDGLYDTPGTKGGTV